MDSHQTDPGVTHEGADDPRSVASAAFEHEVQTLARQIAAAGASERAGLFHLSRWSERVLDWAMSHPGFKTQLFRFVDVFPACRGDSDILQHLREYFTGVDVPRALGLGLAVAERLPFGAHLPATAARRNIMRMARQLIAGSGSEETVPRLERLWRSGEAATVDLLGEKTVAAAEAERYAARVAEMLAALVSGTAAWPPQPHLERDPWGAVPRVNLSVKPTALSPHFAPRTAEAGLAEAYARLRPILYRARAAGATIHLDMEHDAVKDMTLALLRRIGAEWPDGPQLGCVIQAYRKDARADLAAIIGWAAQALRVPLAVRLVKGAYWDYETVVASAEGWPTPVFERKAETDASYEACVELLLAHAGAVRPVFGSHNLRSIAYAIAAARRRGLPAHAIEHQLLYGMAEPVHAALTRLGHRVRVYAPVGDLVAGMAYLVRRLLENTSNESFIRHRFAEGQALDALVAPPAVVALPEPGDLADPPPTDPTQPGRFRNAPHAELHRPAVRERLQAAVAAVRLDLTAPVLIEGRPVATGGDIVSVDPGDIGTVVCRSGRAGPDEATRAIESAARAWPAWRDASWRARAGILFRAAALMRERRDELAALEVFEAGKPIPEADADVCEAIDFCEYYGREALRLGAGAAVDSPPGERNAYTYQSRGVAVVIAPWNFPLAIPTGMVTAALVTGNTVVLKPAEQTPGVGLRLVEILHEAGLPPAALAFLPGIGEEVGPTLVEHPETACLAFTGSKAVGLALVEAGAVHRAGQRQVKRVIAEMGGKNAIVVDTDADLDEAVPAIVASAFGYAGQKCSAAARLIAVGGIYDELLERVIGATAVLPVGHPRALDTVVGPLIDEAAYRRVRTYADGGGVIYRRDDVPAGGWYVGPTVIAPAEPTAPVACEEIFGPVLAVLRAEDFEHALTLTGATDYALTGGVFSRTPSHIQRAAATVRAGNVYINRGITGARVGRQPFGGYGLSGVGSKAGGPDYLLQFVDPRVVTENTIRQGFAGDSAWRGSTGE